MKHSNGFGVAENAKPKEPYIEKNRAIFFFHGPEWERDSGTRDIYKYQKYGLDFFRKSGLLVFWLVVITLLRISFRNPRNYAVTTGVRSVISNEVEVYGNYIVDMYNKPLTTYC